ncbi:MAG: hypothetical protein AAFQ98_05885 [Bacteroidota bacterium]
MKIFITSLIILASSAAFSQNVVTVVVPKTMEVGESSYTYSIKGFEYLMEDIQLAQPELYSLINPKVVELRKKKRLANISYYGGAIVGGTIAVIGVRPALGDTEFLPNGDVIETPPRYGTLIAGTALFLGGITAGLILNPKTDEYNRIVNLFNKNTNSSSIELKVGYNYDPQFGNTASVAFVF